MKCDALAIGAHPDDVELTVGGGVALMGDQGYRAIIMDLTRARLSTRGDEFIREREATEAARILGVVERVNLDLDEGGLSNNQTALNKLVAAIRDFQPSLILAPYWKDRHPDHADASRLVQRAVFWAGVAKFGAGGAPHRPKRIAYYFSHWEAEPTFVVDVTTSFNRKMQAAHAYHSQFDLELEEEPNTYISRPDYLDRIVARARYYGSRIGVEYGEPLLVREISRVPDLLRWVGEQGDVG